MGSPLEGRVVVLTGASLGIGAALADGFRQAGARLVLAARHVEEARGERDDLVVACDVTVDADRRRLVENARSRFAGVDVLVNNAGHARSAPAEEEDPETIRRTVETNLVAAFELSRLVAPLMRESGGGSIVNVASVSALAVMDRYPLASYAASKAGLLALTRELAHQWGRDGIRVNAVSPGWFPTRMNGFLGDPEQRAWVDGHTSLGRPGLVEEMVGPVLFLAGDASSYVTGQVIRVDGGWV